MRKKSNLEENINEEEEDAVEKEEDNKYLIVELNSIIVVYIYRNVLLL